MVVRPGHHCQRMSLMCPSSRKCVLARGTQYVLGGGRQNMGQLLPLKTCLRPSQGQHKKKRQIGLNERGLRLSQVRLKSSESVLLSSFAIVIFGSSSIVSLYNLQSVIIYRESVWRETKPFHFILYTVHTLLILFMTQAFSLLQKWIKVFMQ